MARNRLPAVIIDWDTLASYPTLQHWAQSRKDRVQLILAVTYPDIFDYDECTRENYGFLAELEFEAVIRNSGSLDNLEFKKQVLKFVQGSEFNLAGAFDGTTQVTNMFEESGVLFSIDDIPA